MLWGGNPRAVALQQDIRDLADWRSRPTFLVRDNVMIPLPAIPSYEEWNGDAFQPSDGGFSTFMGHGVPLGD